MGCSTAALGSFPLGTSPSAQQDELFTQSQTQEFTIYPAQDDTQLEKFNPRMNIAFMYCISRMEN
jgi:hypothetical protein